LWWKILEIDTQIQSGLNHPNSLVFIDEIGRMQAFSKKFLHCIDDILSSQVNILGTIIYEDEPWSMKFKTHPDVLLIRVTEQNRAEIPTIKGIVTK
jgi:nucleoside-triphosphatase THEP1